MRKLTICMSIELDTGEKKNKSLANSNAVHQYLAITKINDNVMRDRGGHVIYYKKFLKAKMKYRIVYLNTLVLLLTSSSQQLEGFCSQCKLD